MRKLDLIEADDVSHRTLISSHWVAVLSRPWNGLMLDQNTKACCATLNLDQRVAVLTDTIILI